MDLHGRDKISAVGLSTDAKPARAFTGQLFVESDTGNVYQWVGDQNSGSWQSTGITGKERVVSTPYLYQIAEGNVPGHSPIRIMGRNIAVTTSLVDLTQLSSGLIPLPISPVALEVVSTSAADANGSTGINQLQIHYLDANWNRVTDDLNLAGLTPVNLSVPAIRINGLHAILVGAGKVAAGDVKVRTQGGAGTDYAILKAGETVSFNGSYSVPAGKNAFITGWHASSGKGKETEIRLTANIDPHEFTNSDGAQNTMSRITCLSASSGVTFEMPIKCPEMTDIILRAVVTDTGTVSANGEVSLWVENA